MSDSTSNTTKTCVVCEKPASNRCAKCLKVSYCSRDCQVADWKTHKNICFPAPKVYDVKCGKCGGWGNDLVQENGLCNYCSTQA